MSKLICEGESKFTPDEFLAKSLEIGLNKTFKVAAFGRGSNKSITLQQLGRAVRNGKESLQYQAWVDEAHMIDHEGFIWKFATDSIPRQHPVPAVSVGTIGHVSFKQSVLTTAVKAAMKKV